MSNKDDGSWGIWHEAHRDLNIPQDIGFNLELHLDQDLRFRNSHDEDCVRLPYSQYRSAMKANII